MGLVDGADRMRAGRNILLAHLARSDQALLAPHAEELVVEVGDRLLTADAMLDAVFFPDTAFVSLEESVALDRRVEIAIVGCEGMVGWTALLGCQRSPHAAVARMRRGTLLRVEVAPLRAACARSPTLRAALLQFVHVMVVQMARTIASHLHHSLDQRLACWLLMRHDRMVGDVLLVQHDEIADSLNVRRASVTDGLHLLEGERLVRCNRGKVLVRDRPGLEAFAGQAYGFAEAQYRSLIAPFGKSTLGAKAA